jgi:hypothetical protein
MAREPIHTPVHESQARKPAPDFDNMSDDELFALVSSLEGGNVYEVPAGLVPDGFTYQWKRVSANGQPDYANQAMQEQRGWSAVPQMRHDGRWMPVGTQGPIIVNGLMLMECNSRFVMAKEVYRDREARVPVDGMLDKLNYNKPTSAPRIDVAVRRAPYQGPVEFAVEP